MKTATKKKVTESSEENSKLSDSISSSTTEESEEIEELPAREEVIDEEVETEESTSESDSDNEENYSYPELKGMDYESLYKSKCREVDELRKQNEQLQMRIKEMQSKMQEKQEMIEKVVFFNEQIMRDKEVIYNALKRVNEDKCNLQKKLDEIKRQTYSVCCFSMIITMLHFFI